MRARGFTLIELMVAVAVSLIVVAAGIVLTRATQRSFEVGVDDRAMQETARVALDELSTSLRAAGYGLEPTFVFDFGQASTVMDRAPAGTAVSFGGYPSADGSAQRDSVTQPDELVFYARDPDFARNVTALSTDALTLTAPANGALMTLSPGQVLQVMCYGGSNQWLWAYVTVASSTTAAGGQITVTLEGAAANADFPLQNNLLGQPCFNDPTVTHVFKVDLYRYFVAAMDTVGGAQAWETAGTRPFLMLDQGLRDADGSQILTAIAPDVEDLQVAYVFPLAAAGAQVLGESGAQVTANTAGDDTGINLNPAAAGGTLQIPSFTMPSLDPSRTTHHPANIRAVRVAITVRSERPDPGSVDTAIPAAFNRPQQNGEPGYRRMVFETTVFTRNMEGRLPVFPQLDPTASAGCTCLGTGNCTGNCGGG